MQQINLKHNFFATSIKEVEVCGSKFFELTGSSFAKPTDFIRLNYTKHNFDNCNTCLHSYEATLSNLELQFIRFPTCCDNHKKLLNVPWFDRSDFDGYPKLYADKVFYTWFHILNFIDTEQWKSEIFDFIEYIILSFGSFPTGFGEPLYLSHFIEDMKLLASKLASKNKKDEIIDYLNSYLQPLNNQTEFNVLLSIYNKWFKTFPFELSFFSSLKQHFAKNIPVFAEQSTNKYSGLTKAVPKTKADLINFLLEATNQIIVSTNTSTLYENGTITDIDALEVEIAVQERRQKLKEGYLNESPDPTTKFRRILKEWFRDELRFIKKIKAPFKHISKSKNNLYNDLINACYKMQENKIFWAADENTRTKQVLDLLSSKYITKDQSMYGESEAKKKQGSVDGVISDIGNVEHFIEAFNIDCIATEYITRHIQKLERSYDSKGLRIKFLLVYCNVGDGKFDKICEGYSKFLNSEMEFVYNLQGVTDFVHTAYVNLKVIKSLHKRESSDVILYHFLIKMPFE